MAVVGGSPIGDLKPNKEEDENHKGAAFEDSLPFHRSREQRTRNRLLELFPCHSAIVNYNTIARANFFLKKFLKPNFSALECKIFGGIDGLMTARCDHSAPGACTYPAYFDSA